MVVATSVAVVATLYAIGNVLGRATELTPSSDAPPETASAAAPPASPKASPSAAPSGVAATVPPAGSEAGANMPLSVPGEPAAVAAQPVTGPGRPPLPLAARGPHGTHETTGADYVALTFDDGPDPRWTPEVLELLREHRAKATFCVVGEMVEAFPALVRQIGAEGHTLCNHSWDHDFELGSRSRAAIRKDLERTNEAIRRAAPGTRISYYRQPGGAWTDRVVEVATELGMSSLHWAVDPQDWAQPGESAIADTVTAFTDNGEIVLLHDGGGERHGTVRALRKVLPKLAGKHSLAALPPGVDPPRRHGVELPLKSSQR